MSTLWQTELGKHSQASCILVGTKIDLREDRATVNAMRQKGNEPVTFAEGTALAKRIGAATYLECSALTREGIQEVFQEAAMVAAGLRLGNGEDASGKANGCCCCM